MSSLQYLFLQKVIFILYFLLIFSFWLPLIILIF